MGKTIRWSMKDPAGCVQRGQMPLSQLPGILRDFENSAAETLRRTGADHVLYAVKIYNTEDELTAVQFYMNPMSDEEFSKVAGKGRGTMIYALHALVSTMMEIDEQPTAFDVDKVVEQLKQLKMRYFLTIANTGNKKLDIAYENVGNALDRVIEIVKGGGAE